jgi:putative endonuclease
MRQHQYGVCIVARPSRTISTGVTNELERRMWAPKQTFVRGCTADSGVTRLVYCEEHRMIDDAIARETQIKGWRREKKPALIETGNPTWRDLRHDGFD